MIDAGRLNRVGAIAKPSTVYDGVDKLKVWTNLAVRRMEIIPVAQNEAVFDGSVNNKTEYKITLRYLENLDVTCRIAASGKFMNVTSVVDPLFNKQILELTAVESGTYTADETLDLFALEDGTILSHE